jgi:uncharacterized protein (TIGR02246 family)
MKAVEDELAIRNLIGRYCDGVNRHDAKAWSTTWAQDGKWYFMDDVHEGREQILEHWSEVMGMLDFAIMQAGTATLNVDGDSASGRWYTHEIVRTKGAQGRAIVGVYDDTYTRVDGQWLIASRRYHKLYEVPTDYGETHFPYPTIN